MNIIKEHLNIWFGLGIIAGFLAIPRIVPSLGNHRNPNWGYWRPIGNYGIGDSLPDNVMTYKGGHRQMGDSLPDQLSVYSGNRSLHAFRGGENLLPFGIPGHYKPIWMDAPTRQQLL